MRKNNHETGIRAPHYRSSRLVAIIKKLTLPWYAITTLLYFLAIPITIWVFPATTLLLSVFVLFGGFTASMASLASALVSADHDRALASVENQVSEETVVPSEDFEKEKDDD